MSLLPLVSSVAVGILLLLLLVLLVVCAVHRRRPRAKSPEALVQTQVVVRFGNDYEADEDDENVYVNVDQLDNKEKLKEEAGRVEEETSSDYEDPVSDDEHDYEDAGRGANYIETKEICVNVKDNREEKEEVDEEEEEEETSHDENDYENVTLPLDEQTLDVYGEHEEIYQNF